MEYLRKIQITVEKETNRHYTNQAFGIVGRTAENEEEVKRVLIDFLLWCQSNLPMGILAQALESIDIIDMNGNTVHDF